MLLTKWSDPAGLMKLFLHELLSDDVTKAIFVDTDAFFLTDPALLWEEFSHWGPNVAVSIPYHPNLVIEEWYNASMICSCIMLLHLKRLRSVRLMDSSFYRADDSGLYPPALAPPTFTALFGLPGSNGHENASPRGEFEGGQSSKTSSRSRRESEDVRGRGNVNERRGAV